MRSAVLALAVLGSGCLPVSNHKGVTETTYLVVGTALLVGALVGIALDVQPEVEAPPRPIRPEANP